MELERGFGDDVHHCRFGRVQWKTDVIGPAADILELKLERVFVHVTDEVEHRHIVSILDEASVGTHRTKGRDNSTEKEGTDDASLRHTIWDSGPFRENVIVKNVEIDCARNCQFSQSSTR